jgi:hypothetical protein
MNSIQENNQELTLCGVNVHFQNGIVERMIRLSKEQARDKLIPASSRCPSVINIHFWPFALRHAAESHNNTVSLQNESKITI